MKAKIGLTLGLCAVACLARANERTVARGDMGLFAKEILNGMNTGAKPKILPIGKGEHDDKLLRIIAASGYTGPIGILDHRSDTDAEVALRQNLGGLETAVPHR